MKEQTYLPLYYAVAIFVIAMFLDYSFLNGFGLFGDELEFMNGFERFLEQNRLWVLLGFSGSFMALCFAIPAYRSIRPHKKFTASERAIYVALFVVSFCALMGIFFVAHNLFYYPLAVLLFTFATTRFFRVFARVENLEDKSYDIGPETSVIDTSLSFNLECQGGGYINITNPARGIFIGGSSGSGKSVSFFNQIIQQGIEKDYAAIIFDYKYPNVKEGQYTLVNKVYTEFVKMHSRGKKPTQEFYYVNYHDVSRSHRVNFLHPDYLPTIVSANEISQTLIKNLSGKGNKGDAFWLNNAITLCTGTIWMMKKYYPKYCTLPHVILLINNQNFDRVIDMMNQDIEIAPLISSITTASNLKAGPQLAGVMSSLQTEFAKILNNRIFWVHSGNDFDLDINSKSKPKWVVLGSHQSIERSISPLIACIISVALKNMNQPGKLPSMAMLDEGPQIFIPDIHNYPATMRSNKVSMVYSAQDFVLMNEQLGENLAKSLLANLNYQFLGKVGDPETAEKFARAIGKHEEIRKSINDGVNKGAKDNVNVNAGTSFAYHEKYIVPPEKLNALGVGEFVGISVESEKTKVMGRIKVNPNEKLYEVESFVDGVDEKLLEMNYRKIYTEVEDIISGSIAPIEA